MMAYPFDDKRIILALQIDHSRVAGYFAAHWGNKDFDRPSPYDSVVLAAGEHDIGCGFARRCLIEAGLHRIERHRARRLRRRTDRFR